MKLTYVKATLKDISLIIKLDQAAFCRDFDNPFKDISDVEKVLRDSDIFLIYNNREPIGYYGYQIFDKNSAEITALCIIPIWQNQGIGEKIIQKILGILKDKKNIKIVTHPLNTIMLRICNKKGFLVKSKIENYFGDGEPRLILEKINN